MSRSYVAAVLGVTVAVLAATSPARAQDAPTVEVEVDRSTVTRDDEIEVTVTLRGSFDQFQEPTFEGFAVAGRMQSREFTLSGGRMVGNLRFTYRIQPQRDGTLTIGAAAAIADGKVVARSAPVPIQVAKTAEPPPLSAEDAQDLDALAEQALFLHGTTAKTKVYQGEPFVIAWNLYFRRDVQVESAEITDAPSLEGLLAEEILESSQRPRVDERRIGSRMLRVVPRSIQLVTPLEPGTVTIGTMTCKVQAGDFFRTRATTLRSRPFTLQILPLPEAGRPAGFAPSNVGDFSLAVTLGDGTDREPTTARTGQRLVLDVTVSGRGNLVGLKPPDLIDPQGLFAVTASTTEDRIVKDATGVHGERAFQFLLTPLKPGSHATPTVRLATFDPDRQTYRTLEVPGRPLTVEGAAVAAAPGEAPFEAEDLRPLIESVTLEARSREPFAASTAFLLLTALPLAGFLVIEARYRWRRRLESDPVGRRSKGATGNAQKRLRAAVQAMRDGLVKDFYGQVARTLTSFLEERANLPVGGMTHEELRRATAEVGFPPELVERLVAELEHCDFARFAPLATADQQMKETLARAGTLIDDLAAAKTKPRP